MIKLIVNFDFMELTKTLQDCQIDIKVPKIAL